LLHAVNFQIKGKLIFDYLQKFANSEVGQLLWNVFMHGTADALRIAALSV
jgi:hypothetical protein